MTRITIGEILATDVMRRPHTRRRPGGFAAVLCGGLLIAAGAAGQPAPLREYVDPQGRFSFSYPPSFGDTAPGTNDGFGDRVAAVRFGIFSSAAIGGEAALTRGFPMIDLQAAGGLYDAIVLELFPDSVRAAIQGALPRLTADNLCQAIGQEQHLDPNLPAFQSLTPPQRSAIVSSDRTRNEDPRMVRCAVDNGVVTFDKEVAFQEGGPRQHVYGAVRFLDAPYSTFQIVRAGGAPDAALLDEMTAVVRSWRGP